MCQPELQFNRPKVTPDMVAQMEQVLHNHCTPWVLAFEVVNRLAVGSGEAGKRIVRELASQSEGRIISGQKGYCHVSRATDEEVKHSAAQLLSQASEMTARANQQLQAKGLPCA